MCGSAVNGVKTGKKAESKVQIYEIMHMDRLVARVSSTGLARIFSEQFMPYDLYLEEEDDIDTRINNLSNFYYWCASRVLSLDRKYAKEILNSIGASQAVTDKDRAAIALSYRCVSLTDVFWIRHEGEEVFFADINLYDNPLNEAVVEISLRGKQMTVTNEELAPDLSTRGCFPKAWIRRKNQENREKIYGNDLEKDDKKGNEDGNCEENNKGGFKLLKDGGRDAVEREFLASEICQCFGIKQVKYRKIIYKGEPVTESNIVTSKRHSIVSKMAFEIYALNHDMDVLRVCRELDPEAYYGMNILDYLIGNTDRHPENWGVLVDNKTNQYVSLYPLMDFNRAFYSYETLDGSNCQTVLPEKMNQREAAVQAVKQIGLRQIKDVDMELFSGHPEWAEMFQERLNYLKEQKN